jgi:hypothetical protein
MERILETLTKDLKIRSELDLSECFIDGAFVPARKVAFAWANIQLMLNLFRST